MSYYISHRSYGGIRVNGNVTAQTVGTTPELVTQWDEIRPASGDITADILTTFDLTVTDAGDYEVILDFSLTGTNSILWTFEFYVDGVPSGIQGAIHLNNISDVHNVTVSDVLTLAEGAAVSVYAFAEAAAKNFIITDGRFAINRMDGFEEV